jgi:hypothetical protein
MNANRRNGPRSERGFSFVLVLILMLVGVLVLTAVLRYMGTGLKAAEVHQQKMGEFYAADSGLNDGLWRIKNDRLSPTYDNYDYSGTAWTYVMNDGANPVLVNGENVSISISNEWMVKDLTPPGNAQAVIEGSGTTVPKLLVVGIVDAVPTATLPGTFRIKMVYTGAGTPAFSVQTVGIWLPPGYTYAGTSSLDPPAPAHPLYSSVSTDPWKSGSALVWRFSPTPIPFGDIPHSASEPANERIITFQFNGPIAGKPPAIAWVDTSLDVIGGTRFTWDGDKKVYAISATAGQTTLTQHNLKVDLRQMAASIQGDYVAAGGTLMTMSPTQHPSGGPVRDIPTEDPERGESTATVNSIPEDASVAAAYLYWAGWLSGGSQTINLGNRDWTISGGSNGWGSASTRVHDPFNGTGTGTSAVESPRIISLTNPENLSSYSSGALTVSWDQSMASSSSGPYYKLFTFEPFAVPAGATIDNLTVYVTARRVSSSDDSDIRACINVGGTRYAGSSNNPTSDSGFRSYPYKWTTNPAGGGWTPEAINAIQQFGVYSTDLMPNVRVTSVYAVVNYSVTRVPTIDTDGDSSPSPWTPSTGSNLWSLVAKTTTADETFITSPSASSGGYRLFTIPAAPSPNSFLVPAGDTVAGLTVNIRARDSSSGQNNIRPSIKVNGTVYPRSINDPPSGIDPPDSNHSFQSNSYTWPNNPAGGAWTPDQINGVVSTTELQQIGVRSFDLDPSVRVSMVNARVDCIQTRVPNGDGGDTFGTWTPSPSSPDNLWDKVNELTPNGSTDYMVGAPSSAPALTETDKLYFDMTLDNNFGTFTRIEAMNGANITSPFSYVIPSELRKAGFKMRFYYTFTESSKTIHVDNVHLDYQPLSVGNTAYLKIDGHRVYFDPTTGTGIGEDTTGTGTQVLTSTNIQTIPSQPDSGTWYSAKMDVTKLVQAFSLTSPVPEATNHPGNATYTVGGVNATYGSSSEIAYAGWSLVIVYTSPETSGHQLYLYDQFRRSNNSGDRNGGGSLVFPIGGFLVPERIQGETLDADAAKLTAFVVEGDEYYGGDYLALNGTKLWDGMTSSGNSPGSPNNVWNDKSVGLNADGVDIDTFHVPWDSNRDGIVNASDVLHTGDTSATVTIHTDTDIWEMVYLIISFRSEVTVGGSLSFLIE